MQWDRLSHTGQTLVRPILGIGEAIILIQNLHKAVPKFPLKQKGVGLLSHCVFLKAPDEELPYYSLLF